MEANARVKALKLGTRTDTYTRVVVVVAGVGGERRGGGGIPPSRETKFTSAEEKRNHTRDHEYKHTLPHHVYNSCSLPSCAPHSLTPTTPTSLGEGGGNYGHKSTTTKTRHFSRLQLWTLHQVSTFRLYLVVSVICVSLQCCMAEEVIHHWSNRILKGCKNYSCWETNILMACSFSPLSYDDSTGVFFPNKINSTERNSTKKNKKPQVPVPNPLFVLGAQVIFAKKWARNNITVTTYLKKDNKHMWLYLTSHCYVCKKRRMCYH